MTKAIAAVAAALLLAGCANKAVIDYDTATDFTTFQTYAWKDSNEDLRDTAPLWHDRIVAGIKRRLSDAGMREVGENPDVYVTYYTAEKQETTVITDQLGYGYDTTWGGRYGMGAASVTSREVTYDIGTLIVDIWDAERQKLVWRASASDVISDKPEEKKEMLERMLDSMVEEWQAEQAKKNAG